MKEYLFTEKNKKKKEKREGPKEGPRTFDGPGPVPDLQGPSNIQSRESTMGTIDRTQIPFRSNVLLELNPDARMNPWSD